jgi:hypothetical protein
MVQDRDFSEPASQLRGEVKEALVCIEESIRSAQKAKPFLATVVPMDKTAAARWRPLSRCTKNLWEGFG